MLIIEGKIFLIGFGNRFKFSRSSSVFKVQLKNKRILYLDKKHAKYSKKLKKDVKNVEDLEILIKIPYRHKILIFITQTICPCYY